MHRFDDAQSCGPSDPEAKFRCVGASWADVVNGGCAVSCPDFVD